MEIDSCVQNVSSIKYVENRLNRWNRFLEANKIAQNRLELFHFQLKERLNKIEEQCYQHKLKVPNELEIALKQSKQYLKTMFEQQLIKTTTISDVKIVRKLLNGSNSKSSQNLPLQKFNENPKEINFQDQGKKNGKTGLQMYKQWRKIKGKKKSKIPFNCKQINILLQKMKKYGKNWEKVSGFFPNRSINQIQEYYNDLRKETKIMHGRWNLRQNLILLVLVEHIGQGKWAAISRKLPQKTDVMIRQRFCNILKPQISKTVWTKFQQQQLLRLAPLFDYKWSRMNQQICIFNQKTDNALRRKFRSLLIDKPQQQILDNIKNPKLAQAILKDKKNRKKSKRKIKILIKEQKK